MITIFFNEYGVPTQHKFVGRNEQLKEAGYDESGVENTFGKGWSNDGQYPQSNENYGTFVNRSNQLSEVGLNIDNYELMFGEGYVSKEQPNYLTFTAMSDGCSVGFYNSERRWNYETPVSFKYSIDGGVSWSDYTWENRNWGEIIELPNGESVKFRGVNENLHYVSATRDTWVLRTSIRGDMSASGDVTSLLNGIGGDAPVPANCYQSMFYSCTSLVTAPELPSTTLASYCYQNMFGGCTSLKTAPALPATTLGPGCYYSMFSGCTGITSHHVATMNTSSNVFQSNSSCTTFTIDNVTPPEISSTTISGLKSDCIIYVPSESVDSYKAAQYWSERASYIQEKPSE